MYVAYFKEFMRRMRNTPHKYTNLMKTTNLIKTPEKPLFLYEGICTKEIDWLGGHAYFHI